MNALQEFADRLLYTPLWDGLNLVAFVLGMAGIFAILLGYASTRKAKVLAWSGVGLLLLSIVASMLFEEILPTWPSLPEARRLPYALSFGGIILFLVMFVYSGYRLIADGLFLYFPQLFTSGPGRREAVRALAPGVLWFLASGAVFAVSLLGYHGRDVIFGAAVLLPVLQTRVDVGSRNACCGARIRQRLTAWVADLE